MIVKPDELIKALGLETRPVGCKAMNKVYIWINSDEYGNGNVIATASDEDGVTITQHVSSSPSWARSDINKPHHHKRMAERYPTATKSCGAGHPQGVRDD